MHHTHYSRNLRKAQHKTIKLLSLSSRSCRSVDDSTPNVLRAAIAALLVLVALLQMDPANAQPTMDIGGYGTLQLNGVDQQISAPAVNNELKMIIQDDQLNLIVDQTFSNPTQNFHTGEYWFALPADAQIRAWHVQIEPCSTCAKTGVKKCQPDSKLATTGQPATAKRVKDRLQIATPRMSPNQRLHVHIDINLPLNGSHRPANGTEPTLEEFDAEVVNGVAAAVQAIGSVAATHAFGVLQPL